MDLRDTPGSQVPRASHNRVVLRSRFRTARSGVGDTEGLPRRVIRAFRLPTAETDTWRAVPRMHRGARARLVALARRAPGIGAGIAAGIGIAIGGMRGDGRSTTGIPLFIQRGWDTLI